MHVMAVFLQLLYNTTQAIQVLTRILLFQKAERGGKKKLIHLSEKRQRFSWGFIAENELLKLKGVSEAISPNHNGEH